MLPELVESVEEVEDFALDMRGGEVTVGSIGESGGWKDGQSEGDEVGLEGE